MRSLIIAFVGAVVFSSQALAADAAKNFEGFTVQFGTGYQSVKNKTSNILMVLHQFHCDFSLNPGESSFS